MIEIRRATVVRVFGERPGVLELAVLLDGSEARAIAYPALTGPAGPGDTVMLNTSAVALDLGTGGWHFVIAVERNASSDAPGTGYEHAIEPATEAGHVMKLRY